MGGHPPPLRPPFGRQCRSHQRQGTAPDSLAWKPRPVGGPPPPMCLGPIPVVVPSCGSCLPPRPWLRMKDRGSTWELRGCWVGWRGRKQSWPEATVISRQSWAPRGSGSLDLCRRGRKLGKPLLPEARLDSSLGPVYLGSTEFIPCDLVKSLVLPGLSFSVCEMRGLDTRTSAICSIVLSLLLCCVCLSVSPRHSPSLSAPLPAPRLLRRSVSNTFLYCSPLLPISVPISLSPSQFPYVPLDPTFHNDPL